jgi:hypothetical protein
MVMLSAGRRSRFALVPGNAKGYGIPERTPGTLRSCSGNKAFPFEVRQLLYGSTKHRYRSLFTIEGDTVIVLHIHHGRRNPLTH